MAGGQNTCKNKLPLTMVEYLLLLMVCVDKIDMYVASGSMFSVIPKTIKRTILSWDSHL